MPYQIACGPTLARLEVQANGHPIQPRYDGRAIRRDVEWNAFPILSRHGAWDRGRVYA